MKRQNRKFSLAAMLAPMLAIAALLLASGCSKLKARDELNKGVAAFKAQIFQVAVEHFKAAVDLDPTLLNARLYLATAYANQYVPGADSESNKQIGEQAVAEFQKVLQQDPTSIGSISGIASIYFQMRRLNDAKEFYKKQIAVEPTNAEAYYSIGVINWTQTYQPRMELKRELKLRADEPIKDAKKRAALAEVNMPLIEEGMEAIQKAMANRERYDDAMAYLNLLYREKADLVDSPAEREQLLTTADEWVGKSLEIKKKKAAEESPGQVTTG